MGKGGTPFPRFRSRQTGEKRGCRVERDRPGGDARMELNEMVQMSECDNACLPPPPSSSTTTASRINVNTGSLPSTAASRNTDTQQQTIQPLLPRSQIPEGLVAAWLNRKSEGPLSHPSKAGD